MGATLTMFVCRETSILHYVNSDWRGLATQSPLNSLGDQGRTSERFSCATDLCSSHEQKPAVIEMT